VLIAAQPSPVLSRAPPPRLLRAQGRGSGVFKRKRNCRRPSGEALALQVPSVNLCSLFKRLDRGVGAARRSRAFDATRAAKIAPIEGTCRASASPLGRRQFQWLAEDGRAPPLRLAAGEGRAVAGVRAAQRAAAVLWSRSGGGEPCASAHRDVGCGQAHEARSHPCAGPTTRWGLFMTAQS
jgi:hypothetical protein